MTIKELYKWAKKKNCENYDLHIAVKDAYATDDILIADEVKAKKLKADRAVELFGRDVVWR